jgi:lipopolysaccharide export LptBFGC system permease protein LptF
MGYMLMLLILAAILMGGMIYLKDWLAWRAEQKSQEIRWD